MKVIIRGGGDLASGVALRLFNIGFSVLVLELAEPRFVRRSVSFGNAVYEESWQVENVTASLIKTAQDILSFDFTSQLGVFVDPDNKSMEIFNPDVIIDARMMKKVVKYNLSQKPMVVGLGPGFTGGQNCHAAIETNRGHFLGRVLWNTATQKDTGVPGDVKGKSSLRVLRAPTAGKFQTKLIIGDLINEGEMIGTVDGEPVTAPFNGCLRGLIKDGLKVKQNEKIGDVDPRLDPELTKYVSEKSLAIAGGILEAILSYFNVIH